MSAELYDAGWLAPLRALRSTSCPRRTPARARPRSPFPSRRPRSKLPSRRPSAPTATAPPNPNCLPRTGRPARRRGPAAEGLEAVDEDPAPRKVFGMSLTRSRKAKSKDAPELDSAIEIAIEVLPEPVAVEAIEAPAPELEAAARRRPRAPRRATPNSPAVAPNEIVALEPTVTDHTDEVRAMRALLEASEQVRQAAEARTAAAEAQLRTVTNSVQEWQIRHREAEATITELAGSLTGAEGRMAELHQQLSAMQAERDELVSQLDAATSPASS